jgi:hypothetical protein
MIGEHAGDDAQDRAGEHGRCDHQALLSRAQIQVFGDEDGERAQEDPDHEAHVEIEERSDECGQMPCAQETAVHRMRLSIPAHVARRRTSSPGTDRHWPADRSGGLGRRLMACAVVGAANPRLHAARLLISKQGLCQAADH